MKIYRSQSLRIYPNTHQLSLIDKTITACEKLWNLTLSEYSSIEYLLPYSENSFENYKPHTELEWSKQYKELNVDSQALSYTRRHFIETYKQYYNKRRKKKIGHPKFKQEDLNSYTTIGRYTRQKDNRIFIPKLKWVKFRGSDLLPYKIQNLTIKRVGHKYFAVLVYEENYESIHRELNIDKALGLDMSFPKFYVDSEGRSPEEFEKRYKRNEKKLKRLQHILSRKKKNSRRYNKLKNRIRSIHFHITNQRKDYLHNLSRRLVNQYDIIGVEDLALENMKKYSKGYAKTITKLCWNQFIWYLQYKLEREGKLLYKSNRFYPSTATCSSCGHIQKGIKLSDREWTCEACHTKHNRDINAAINLKQQAISHSLKCSSSCLYNKDVEMSNNSLETKGNFYI